MSETFKRARDFILERGRLLERRLFEVHFEGAPASLVEAAVRAHQNPDGGLGHALEPDLRCSSSQPIFAEMGLSALSDVGLRAPELAAEVGRFLENASASNGLVPAIFAQALESAHAAHWDSPYWLEPDLNPSLAVCALLREQGISNDWFARLALSCDERLDAEMPSGAHELFGAARFAAGNPDPSRGRALKERISEALAGAEFFVAEAPVEVYGLTPLHFAATPFSPFRPFFSDATITAHLDDLLSRQRDDGGWPISWPAPGPAAECEWRARLTLEALRTLTGYGRIQASA